jgi:hypothetical protein
MKCPWVDAAMMRGRQSSVSPEHPFRAACLSKRRFLSVSLMAKSSNIVVRACRRDHGCVSSNL